jgi:hypothetical protein
MYSYSSIGPRQIPPKPKEIVEEKNTWRDTFKADCALLEQLWPKSEIPLEQIAKQTHWRSLGQISKIARNKLGLPPRARGPKRSGLARRSSRDYDQEGSATLCSEAIEFFEGA